MSNKFKYIGEYPDGKTELTVYGVVFSPGAAVEVPHKFVGKARGNRFFEEVAEPVAPVPAVEAAPEPDDVPPLEPAAPVLTREELIAVAEKHDIKIDKRWTYAKISDAIIAHSKDLP